MHQTDPSHCKLAARLNAYPGTAKELKTAALINGIGGWSKVDSTERKAFLESICGLATDCATVFSVAFSFAKFDTAVNAGHEHPFGTSYWLGVATFVAALVQQKMQKLKENKGLTVFICDDNKMEMANLSDALHDADPWFDTIYDFDGKAGSQRFNRIVNSAFAVKSQHSSLVQVADAVAYVYRRHLELKSEKEAWEGEQKYISDLFDTIEPNRELLGRASKEPCIQFYQSACHASWTL